MLLRRPRRAELETLMREHVCPLVVAKPVREQAGPEKGLDARQRLVVVRGECVLAPPASFAQMTALVPEAHQCTYQPELLGSEVGTAQRVQGEAHVFMLCLEPVHPACLVCPRQMGLGLLRQAQEVVGVALSERVTVVLELEPLGRVLADRLEHPVPRSPSVALADEALLEQRLERVVCVSDLLRRLVRAATDEDGEAREERCSSSVRRS